MVAFAAMDAYRATVDKRDQRAFALGFGYVDPARASAPRSVARTRRPLEELVHWETW